MSYTELPSVCFTRGPTFAHDNACCYRATVENVDKGVYTVSWLESTPLNSTNPAQITALSYDPGWCLAPCLAEPPLYPFCSGDVILVLDNQSSGPDRFLIIGYDKYHMPGGATPLVPCTPSNLGFHITGAQYGAPYYTKSTDSSGQVQCTPINPFEDYGGLTIPKGTLTNTEPVIIIATTPGNCTCIKSFQAAGFTALCSIVDAIASVRGYNTCYYVGDGELDIDTATNNGSLINMSRSVYCLKNSTNIFNYHSSQSVSLSTYGYPSVGFNYLYYGAPSLNYQGNLFFQTPVSGPDEISAIWAIGTQYKLAYQFIKNPDGTVTPSFSATAGNFGTYTQNATGNVNTFGGLSTVIGVPPTSGLGLTIPEDYNVSLTGSSICADNGYNFQITKTITLNETYVQPNNVSAALQTLPTKTGQLLGPLTDSLNQSLTATALFNIGGITWTDTITQSVQSNIVNVIYASEHSGVWYWALENNHTVSGSASCVEEFNFPVAINIAAGQIIRLRCDSNYEVTTTETSGVITTLTTLSGSVYLEIVTKNSVVVLESWSGNIWSNSISQANLFSYIGLVNAAYTQSPSVSVIGSSGCCMEGPVNALFVANSLFNDAWGVTITPTQYYDIGINMTCVCLSGVSGNFPMVSMYPSMDGRCMHVQYTLNGVQKDRYFVDSVEYTLAQLQDR